MTAVKRELLGDQCDNSASDEGGLDRGGNSGDGGGDQVLGVF